MFSSPPFCMLCEEQTGRGLFTRTALICTSSECVRAANAAAAAHGVLRPQRGLVVCHGCSKGILAKSCPRCDGSLEDY
jgi:hypothetical protein